MSSVIKLLAKSIPIDTALHPDAIDSQAVHLSRYHLIKDLALKGPEQIACFLERIEQIHSCAERVELSLITVLCNEVGDKGLDEMFPLFDFIGIRSRGCNAYGVMFSTYLHDLDREAIAQHSLSGQGEVACLKRLLMESLFSPTFFNCGKPPFPDQKPVFIFPRSLSSISSTDRYMAHLGFNMSLFPRSTEALVMRVYHHRSEAQPFDCGSINPAIFAVGQACVEMATGVGAASGTCLKPFDRSGFNIGVQADQTRIAQLWLRRLLRNLSTEWQGSNIPR